MSDIKASPAPKTSLLTLKPLQPLSTGTAGTVVTGTVGTTSLGCSSVVTATPSDPGATPEHRTQDMGKRLSQLREQHLLTSRTSIMGCGTGFQDSIRNCGSKLLMQGRNFNAPQTPNCTPSTRQSQIEPKVPSYTLPYVKQVAKLKLFGQENIAPASESDSRQLGATVKKPISAQEGATKTDKVKSPLLQGVKSPLPGLEVKSPVPQVNPLLQQQGAKSPQQETKSPVHQAKSHVQQKPTPAQEEVKAPVQKEVESPVQEEVKSPVEAEVESPVQAEVESPVQEEVKAPVEAEVESPVQAEVEPQAEAAKVEAEETKTEDIKAEQEEAKAEQEDAKAEQEDSKEEPTSEAEKTGDKVASDQATKDTETKDKGKGKKRGGWGRGKKAKNW